MEGAPCRINAVSPVQANSLRSSTNHPVGVDLLTKVEVDEEDKAAMDTAQVLSQTALTESGYEIAGPSAPANRVYRLKPKELGDDPDAPLKEVEVDEKDEEKCELVDIIKKQECIEKINPKNAAAGDPEVDEGVPEELISKGDASYESAWIDKLLGNSDTEDDEPGQVASEARGQSRHNSCQPDISRQDNASRGIFLFCMFLFWFRIPPLN